MNANRVCVRALVALAAIGAVTVGAGGQPVELVVNGDFETGGPSPWVDGNLTSSWHNDYILGHGNYCDALLSGPGPLLTQTLTTAFLANTPYSLSFTIRFVYTFDGAPSPDTCRFEMGVLNGATFTPAFSQDFTVYNDRNLTPKTATYTTGASNWELGQLITIRIQNLSTGWHPFYVDDVSLIGPATPPGPAPLLTADPANGSLLDFGHVAPSTASTVTTVTLGNAGQADSVLTVNGATFGAGASSLFALSPEWTGGVSLGVGDLAHYGIKFLGSPTAATYTDTVTFTTTAGSVTYNLSAIVDAAGPHMGDANRDKKVDLQDFSLLKSHYNETGTPPWEHGNFNGDTKVDLQDFSLLKSHYNHTGTSLDTPVTGVPEPASLLLALAGAAGLLRRRR